MILTLQQGGGIPPLLNYTILNPQSSSPFDLLVSGKSTKTGKDEDDLLELLKYVKDLELLPNDSAYITLEIQNLLDVRSAGYPVNQKHLDRVWSKIVQMLNPGRHHADLFEKVHEKALSNGFLSELAITTDGNFVGLDENNNLKSLSIEDARSGKYQLLTNSHLLNMNSGDSDFILDSSLLRIVENGISWSKINELIKDASMTIGSAKLQQSGYTVKMAQDLQAGLEIAKEYAGGLPLLGLYKSRILSEEQTQQAMFALNYIYNALPSNARTLLEFRAGSEKAAKEHIFNRLGALLNPKFEFDTTLELDPSGKKPGTLTKTDDDKLPDLTEVEKWLYGYGYKEQFNLVGGTSDAITFTSTVLSMTDGGKPVGQTTLQKAIGGDFNGILDTRSVTMGNQVIDTNALDKVVLKDGRIYKVELPLNQELYRQNIIAPDYNYSKNKEKADAIIKERNITDKQQINQIYEECNLPIKYDENGELITTHYVTFGALHAFALDLAFEDEDSLAMSSYLKEISQEKEAKNALQIYRQINGLPQNDETLKDWDYQDKFWNERKHNALYEGVLYIPIQADFANAKVGLDISPYQMDALYRKLVETDAAKQLKRTGWDDGK